MSVLRVIALTIGWIVMLAGSLVCIAAGVFAVAVSFGAAFGPGWSGTTLIAIVGFGLMVGALPMMFFGCEAHRQGKTTGFAPGPEFFDVGMAPVRTAPIHQMPAREVSLSTATRSDDHLSSRAVLTLASRR